VPWACPSPDDALVAGRGAQTRKQRGRGPNQLINIAVAEKVSAWPTEAYFDERARRADVPKALRVLERAGVGNPPLRETKSQWQKRRG